MLPLNLCGLYLTQNTGTSSPAINYKQLFQEPGKSSTLQAQITFPMTLKTSKHGSKSLQHNTAEFHSQNTLAAIPFISPYIEFDSSYLSMYVVEYRYFDFVWK